jgi:hypothetical protein
MLPLGACPCCQFLLERFTGARVEVVFATTERPDDDVLADCGCALGVSVFRGSELNVADRCLQAARHFGFDWLVRVTAIVPSSMREPATLPRAMEPTEAVDLYSTKSVFRLASTMSCCRPRPLRAPAPT